MPIMSGGGGKEVIGYHYSRFHHPYFMPFLYGIEKKCACGILETKADVGCSEQKSTEGEHMRMVAKVCRNPT